MGGGDRYQQSWFSSFNGRVFDVREAEAYKISRISLEYYKNFSNRFLNDRSYLGLWRTNIKTGSWFPNDKLIIVLMDNAVGSSGENMINMMRTMDNVIFIGSSTVGCNICGNYTDIYLPNSGMPVRAGSMLRFPETQDNIDGIGIQPDIWCDPSVALTAALNMIEQYELE